MALALKQYQVQALNALERFFVHARVSDSKQAFEKMVNAPDAFDHERVSYMNHFKDAHNQDVPCVCVRVPTGGGKTLIAAHSVAVAAKHYANTDAPVVLWLVPSDMIRQQTLKALADVSHPYRQAVMQEYGDRIKVCDLEGLQTINPHDVGKSCLIIVTTMQAFNVNKTEKRNVYAFYEELSPHFSGLTPQQESGMERVDEETIKAQPHLTASDIGRVKHSLANWFNLHRPIIVLDEAHKSRTKLSFETFARLNPICLVELTATPRNNNVLYSVSAAELKTAQMIKLPIVLTEHPDGWQACLRDAWLQRQKLELNAQEDALYIRPILLVQAEPKNGEATVDEVRAHLIQEMQIPEAQIAVSTGSTKELNDVNLFAPDCAIRVVITVEALKEGWDCSFAYVLASLQNMNSAVDVEQILGRVLRMPYAQMRPIESLNKAYAHVVSDNTINAAAKLKDRMVENMGFNRWEADLAVQAQGRLAVGQDQTGERQRITPESMIPIDHSIEVADFPDEVKAKIQILPTNQGASILIQQGTSDEEFKQIEHFVLRALPNKKQEAVQASFDYARSQRQAVNAPENWNAQFALIPQLCLFMDEHWQLIEKEVIENAVELDLLKYPLNLSFNVKEVANSYEIDMNVSGEQLTYKQYATEQLAFNNIQTNLTEHDLMVWLDKQVRQKGLTQTQLRAYLVKLIAYLIHERSLTLTALFRTKHQLAQAIKEEINLLFTLARTEAFQGELFAEMMICPEPAAWNQFEFKTGIYPLRHPYTGSFEFKKHFYAQIDDLAEKTKNGVETEEFICARLIDMSTKVKYWVRNIPQQSTTSFWLPVASGYFYPDFVCELENGEIAVIEYKGGHLASNDDSREKEAMGLQWAKSSNGKCRFAMIKPQKDDLQHRTVEQQLEAFFA